MFVHVFPQNRNTFTSPSNTIDEAWMSIPEINIIGQYHVPSLNWIWLTVSELRRLKIFHWPPAVPIFTFLG